MIRPIFLKRAREEEAAAARISDPAIAKIHL
jgi:hypothetical protein